MREFNGKQYHEAIPEIQCRADMEGAQVFSVQSHMGRYEILAYTKKQAEAFVWEQTADESQE